MRSKKTIQRPIVGLCLLAFLTVGAFAQKAPKDQFAFGPLNPIKMPKVQRAELPNGIKLFLVEDPEYPTIDVWAMVRAGSVFEPADKTGLASITGTVLRTGGTQSKTGDQIDKELETLAATVETDVGETAGNIRVSVLKEDFDRALAILADILTHPAFREDKIDLAKIMQKSGIARRNDDIGSITYREFNRLMYGKDSPYARQTEYATIDAITRQDLVDFYTAYFHPNNTYMAVWGDFKSADMIAKLNLALAPKGHGWPSGCGSRVWPRPWPMPGSGTSRWTTPTSRARASSGTSSTATT